MSISACQSTQEPIHTVTPTHVEVKETENTIEVSATQGPIHTVTPSYEEGKEPENASEIQTRSSVYVNEDYSNYPASDSIFPALTTYRIEFYGGTSDIRDIVGSAIADEWLNQFDEYGGDRVDSELNIENAIRELKLPREKVVQYMEYYTKEQIDALYSNNPSEINREFANKSALLVNSEIYTLEWVATRTLSDYEQNNIPLDSVFSYLGVIERYNMPEECRALKSTLQNIIKSKKNIISSNLDVLAKWELSAPYRTEYYGIPDFVHELVDSEELENWMNRFVYEAVDFSKLRNGYEYNVINLVRELNIAKQDFIRANDNLIYTPEQVEAIYSADPKQVMKVFGNPYALWIDDKVYSIDWLTWSYVDTYQKAGITKDVLKVYLDKIKNNSMFTEEVKIITEKYNQL